MTDDDQQDSRDPQRRLITKAEQSTAIVVPSLGGLVNDALSIIGAELAQYRSKTKRGITLDLREARVVTGYLEALTKASREAREQARAEDLADLSNEELLQLATQVARIPGASLPSADSLDAPSAAHPNVRKQPTKPQQPQQPTEPLETAEASVAVSPVKPFKPAPAIKIRKAAKPTARVPAGED